MKLTLDLMGTFNKLINSSLLMKRLTGAQLSVCNPFLDLPRGEEVDPETFRADDFFTTLRRFPSTTGTKSGTGEGAAAAEDEKVGTAPALLSMFVISCFLIHNLLLKYKSRPRSDSCMSCF